MRINYRMFQHSDGDRLSAGSRLFCGLTTAALIWPLLISAATAQTLSELTNEVRQDGISENGRSGSGRPPGSTMTLKDIQQKRGTVAKPEPRVLLISPAEEPDPLLRYRFWIPRHALRPGSAQLHMARARMFWQLLPPQRQLQIADLNPAEREREAPLVEAAITELALVFEELHLLAHSDDTSWDHRLRDLNGTDVYAYMLDDVQHARTLARLLRLKAWYHLNRHEFDQACAAIADGYHLAAFVGQGESLIQKLIGLACVSIINDAVEQAIQIPECPSLYWALASVPQPIVETRTAVDWETHNLTQVFPAFAASLRERWTEKEATRQWSAIIQSIRELAVDQVQESQLVLISGMLAASGNDRARERLIAAGISADHVAEMPATQVMIADAAVELRRIGDRMVSGHLLPTAVSGSVRTRNDEYFQRTVAGQRLTSIAASIATLLMPAVDSAHHAEARMVMKHMRLMTIEAIRLHAFQHEGTAPPSLNALDPVPGLPDPFTGQPFEYSLTLRDGTQVLELRSNMPRFAELYGRVVLELKQAGLRN